MSERPISQTASHLSGRRLAMLAFLTAIAAVGLAGCGQSDHATAEGTEARPASFQQTEPQDLLAAVFKRYRAAASYRDRAEARISYEYEGRLETQTAPLQVWFDQNQLYVEAYATRMWRDPEAVTAWISDSETNNFDSQVWKCPVSAGRPQLEVLLSDPLLVDQLGIGMAGPPPQLEWLFAGEPMSRLFEGDHLFSYGVERPIDGVDCVSVEVVATGERFRFWIDPRGGLIRRIELPTITRPDDPTCGEDIHPSIDFIGATFDAPRSGPPFEPLPPKARYVKRFVPLPPAEPFQLLGRRGPEFRVQTEGRRFWLSEQGSDRPITLLLHYSDDPLAVAAAALLHQWTSRLTAEMRDQLRVVLVTEPTSLESLGPLGDDLQLAVAVDGDRRISRGYRMSPGSIIVLRADGSVGWMEPLLESSRMPAFGAIIADLIAGIDVPARVIEQRRAAVEAYRKELDQQRIAGK